MLRLSVFCFRFDVLKFETWRLEGCIKLKVSLTDMLMEQWSLPVPTGKLIKGSSVRDRSFFVMLLSDAHVPCQCRGGVNPLRCEPFLRIFPGWILWPVSGPLASSLPRTDCLFVVVFQGMYGPILRPYEGLPAYTVTRPMCPSWHLPFRLASLHKKRDRGSTPRSPNVLGVPLVGTHD